MRNEVIKNSCPDEDELIITCPLALNQYKNVFTPQIPYNETDLVRLNDLKTNESSNKWMIKKAKQTKEFEILFPIYDNIISPDSSQFFNLSSFELLPIKLNTLENVLFKQQLGTFEEFEERKKVNNAMRFNNKKIFDESFLLNSININDGKHLYFITDNIFEELNNPDCFIKLWIELFDNVKIIQFLDIFYLNIKFEYLVKEYARHVLKEFCKETLEISENRNSLICCFSNTAHKRKKYFEEDFIECNIYNSVTSNKNTNTYLGPDGIEFIKNIEKKKIKMYDFSKLESGYYAWNNGKIYKIGDNGETFKFKGLQFN